MDGVRFQIGQTVYRRLKPDVIGMIVAIVFRESYVEYRAAFADHDEERTYQAIELTTEKSFVAGDGGTAV